MLGVFYLHPHKPGEPEDGPPFGVTADELDAVFGCWFERVDGWVPRHAYPGREGREWLAVYRRKPGASEAEPQTEDFETEDRRFET